MVRGRKVEQFVVLAESCFVMFADNYFWPIGEDIVLAILG